MVRRRRKEEKIYYYMLVNFSFVNLFESYGFLLENIKNGKAHMF